VISIVIPTYRRPEALRATLAAATRLEHPKDDYEIVVVDDGADGATRAVVESFGADDAPRAAYASQPNSGVATARNHGARLATGELLIFLDDDMLVWPDHIAQHLATRERYGDCLVNGHWEFSAQTRAALEETPFGRFRIDVEAWVKTAISKRPIGEHCVEPSGVTAANLGIRRDLYWDLGGFDEAFPVAGCEDQDFSHRAASAGCRFVYNYDIRLEHNDRRVTLEQFCARQERGAVTAVYLAAKHPDDFAGRALIVENRPSDDADPIRLRAKKLAKRILALRPVLGLARGAIRVLERLAPRSRLLRRAYWAMFGVHIYRGVDQGLRELSPQSARQVLAAEPVAEASSRP
jgi:GT2 family glycosyltransferase